MAHTIRNKTKLLGRVRRLRGQVEAVERALEEEVGCGTVLQLIASVRGAINGLMAEVVEDHLELHVVGKALSPQERKQGAAELMDVVRTYLR